LIVETLAKTHGLNEAYALFFMGCGAVGIPALILCLFLAGAQASRHARTAAAPAG
jgi:hypothetical protein